MRYFVAGGKGFIGSAATRYIRQTLEEEATEYDLVDNLDVTDTERLSAAIAGYDIAINAAGAVGEKTSLQDPIWHWQANLMAAVNLFEQAIKHDLKVIQISSAAVDNPNTPYGASKIAADVAAEHAIARDADIVVIRLHNIYGPEQPTTHVVPYMMQELAAGRSVWVGNNQRDYVYKDNVIAFLTELAPKLDPGFYEFGTGVATSDYELVATICKIIGCSLDQINEQRDLDEGTVRVSKDDIVAVTSLEEGLEETWRWYKQTL